ncbi:MAG TPA: hypothetical protein VG755_15135 [Nannocystaceae bacterium]|nr:hypothetical protein [Nannocystaceae bacterium]
MSVDDPRARDMLRAYRREHALSDPRGGAIWDRLERSLDARRSIVDELDEPPAREHWYLRKGWIAIGALAAGVVLALGLAPTIAAQIDAPTLRTEAVQVGEEPRAHTVEIRDEAPVEPPAAPPKTAPAPVVLEEAPALEKPARARTRKPVAATTDDLVVELGLVRRARRALQDGDPKGALAMLDAHAHAFPQGQMLEDRLALRIEALCAAGAERQARAEAKALRRRFPGSAHAAQPCGAK